MTPRTIRATRCEVREMLARRAVPFDGFALDTSPARRGDAERLRRHLGSAPLRGELLSEAEQVARAEAWADAAEQHADALAAKLPPRDRLRIGLSDSPAMARLVGVSQPPPEPTAAPRSSGWTPGMRRLLGMPGEEDR